MKRDYLDYLQDIHTSIENIEKFIGQMTYKDFQKDEKTALAVIKSVEIIGEAVKKLPASFRNKHPKIEWKKMAGMRDILVHEYFGVDLKILWRVIKKRIPGLKPLIAEIIKESTS